MFKVNNKDTRGVYFLVEEISSKELKIVVCEFVVEILVVVLLFYGSQITL